MLSDDKTRFVQLFTDGVVWGNIKLDFSNATDPKLKEMVTRLSGNMALWMVKRDNPDSNEFKMLTIDVFADILGARFSKVLQGDLIDRDHEEKMKKLEEDNQKLVSIIADQKKQLDQLYMESPDKKNIRGIS